MNLTISGTYGDVTVQITDTELPLRRVVVNLTDHTIEAELTEVPPDTIIDTPTLTEPNQRMRLNP